MPLRGSMLHAPVLYSSTAGSWSDPRAGVPTRGAHAPPTVAGQCRTSTGFPRLGSYENFTGSLYGSPATWGRRVRVTLGSAVVTADLRVGRISGPCGQKAPRRRWPRGRRCRGPRSGHAHGRAVQGDHAQPVDHGHPGGGCSERVCSGLSRQLTGPPVGPGSARIIRCLPPASPRPPTRSSQRWSGNCARSWPEPTSASPSSKPGWAATPRTPPPMASPSPHRSPSAAARDANPAARTAIGGRTGAQMNDPDHVLEHHPAACRGAKPTWPGRAERDRAPPGRGPALRSGPR